MSKGRILSPRMKSGDTNTAKQHKPSWVEQVFIPPGIIPVGIIPYYKWGNFALNRVIYTIITPFISDEHVPIFQFLVHIEKTCAKKHPV